MNTQFTHELARLILELDFTSGDIVRMQELAELASDGALSPSEREEAENYNKISHRLALLQSKARVALRGPS